MSVMLRLFAIIWFLLAWWRQSTGKMDEAAYAMASACFWHLTAQWCERRDAGAPRG